jgi:serine/threonine protein kinase
LATRNILIDFGHTLKICDFGLARDINDMDYYIGSNDEVTPFRFMAPESLAEHKYYLQSDV